MTKPLTRQKTSVYHYAAGNRRDGPHNEMSGNCTGLWGDCTDLRGDCTDLRGNLDDIDHAQRPAYLADFVA